MIAVLTTAALLTTIASNAQTLPFPTGPVKIVIAYSKGGPTDRIATPFARELSEELGKPVSIEYVTGTGGTKAPTKLAANPDTSGHTLLLHHIGMATAPSLYRRLQYRPQIDFIPIGRIADAPMILMTRNDLIPEKLGLKPYLRRNQSSITLGYAGVGSASQMCGLLFQKSLGLDLMWIPFRGTKPAMRDLTAGRIDLLCDQTTQAITDINKGHADAKFVTTSTRLKIEPQLATAAESRVQGLEISIWHALYAPKGTPAEIVRKLESALMRAVEKPRFIAAMDAVGVQVTDRENRSATELAQHLKDETNRWAPLIRSSGMYATE